MIKELFVLTIFCFTVSNAVVCNHHTCRSFECGTLRCPDGFVIKVGGGFCGCCDNCVPALKEGDTCELFPAYGGYPYHQGVTNSDPICGDGLKCDRTALKCVPLPQKKENRIEMGPAVSTNTTVDAALATTVTSKAATTVDAKADPTDTTKVPSTVADIEYTTAPA